METKKPTHNIKDWKLVLIISFKDSVGINPPEDTIVIVKFKLSKILIPDIIKNKKINAVKDR